MFSPSEFIKEIEPQLIKFKNERILAAISGGVDSTTAAVLMYKLLGASVIPVMIDTGFLRKNEANKVKNLLKDIIPIQIIDKSNEFINSLEGLEDAEEKRKKFREIFYNTLSEIIKEYKITYLVQGTIAPDWIETQGGIKTQHNVLVQLGIDTEKTWGFKVIEPLADLYKNEVRELARYLGLPKEISERQPFPGPGLLVRLVGKVTKEKLEIEREANDIVEKYLDGKGYSQYFSAILESDKELNQEISNEVGEKVYLYKNRATGVKGDVRSFGKIASISSDDDYEKLRDIVQKITKYDVTHVLLQIKNKEVKKEEDSTSYSIAIRAIITEDFMTADFAKISRDTLEKIADEILEIPKVKEVLYDITSKPPATIEFE
ncbi:GMP synthase [Acidianus sulfidivorans JP7]|uniref:GMP synthase (glutamine-hydrolyzing) n=1 Tax=Acidianus sulfidivorans JP7 TaxID=619593 RepID=A0A2U9IND7_9CREN|nr:ATP-binding protein [Acidianus sulfidivorans]AWR97517.1 GMP synthase [Acidianus sulfidivorans JP7]